MARKNIQFFILIVFLQAILYFCKKSNEVKTKREKMNKELNRHDIRDSAWEKIKLHTIGEKGTRGGNAKDTRHFINGVFWILVGAL